MSYTQHLGSRHEGEIQLLDMGVEACIYIKQVTTKKYMYIEFYYISK
jgi:hypothetical protein